MNRILAAIFIALLALTPSFASRPPILNSIRPLQWESFDPDEGKNVVSNHCTVGKINDSQGFWLTAAHCIVDKDLFIAGAPAYLLSESKELDLAVLYSPTALGKELKLAQTPLNWGDVISTAGYSFGFPEPFYFIGRVANPGFVHPGETQKYSIWDIRCAGGQSGSPVLDSSGRLASVLQIGYNQGFSPVCGGAPYEAVKGFAGAYFGSK